MTKDLTHIRICINHGEVEKAIQWLNTYLTNDRAKERDNAYYLRGNAYRKMGDWQQALNNYQAAIDLNPHSPAVEAKQAAMDILNFYHKDMYNQ